jgi:hypothetical protein
VAPFVRTDLRKTRPKTALKILRANREWPDESDELREFTIPPETARGQKFPIRG